MGDLGHIGHCPFWSNSFFSWYRCSTTDSLVGRNYFRKPIVFLNLPLARYFSWYLYPSLCPWI